MSATDWWADAWPDIPTRPMESLDEQGAFEPDNSLQQSSIEGGGEGLLQARIGTGSASGEASAAAAISAAESAFTWGDWLPLGWISRTAFRPVWLPISELPEDGDYRPVDLLPETLRFIRRNGEEDWEASFNRLQFRVRARRVRVEIHWSSGSVDLTAANVYEVEIESEWPSPDPDNAIAVTLSALNARCTR